MIILTLFLNDLASFLEETYLGQMINLVIFLALVGVVIKGADKCVAITKKAIEIHSENSKLDDGNKPDLTLSEFIAFFDEEEL